MQIIGTIKDMHALSRALMAEDKTIGFVPTMGALHEGHLSLVRRSKAENDATVVSIFVNPAQFGSGEDFLKYPREVEKDVEKLSTQDVDTIFIPDEREMYPAGYSASINIGRIGEILCGASRPGHFNGVASVVAKLFNIVMPDKAYFGQKDLQQTVVINKLVRDLNFGIDIVVCPTVRESDGLAMSSRNKYLSDKERREAAILYKALKNAEELILSKGASDASYVKSETKRLLKSSSLINVEYVEILDPVSLDIAREIKCPVVICLAVKIGNTRLIDNILIEKVN